VFLEFFVVLAFGVGWLILELYTRRLDKKREAEKAHREEAAPPPN